MKLNSVNPLVDTQCCNRCGETKTFSEFARTSRFYQKFCKKCDLKRAQEYRQLRRNKGFCSCGRECEPGLKSCKRCRTYRRQGPEFAKYQKEWYTKNRDKVLAISRAQAQKLKRETMEQYGGTFCSCPGGCDIDYVEFLSIDHINGGGSKHRQQVRRSMYGWLKKNGYPKGYRVLCMNCNFALGRSGYCPHERPTPNGNLTPM